MTADTAFWNELAERYAAQPVENPEAFDRKTAITRSWLRPEHTVLDVGCGTGSFCLRLAPHITTVHGLDFSSEMIRIARGKRDTAGANNVHFHVGPFDASFDALEEGSLDMVCAYSFLHLVEDRPAALAKLYRLLKPGGVFISSTVCIGESWTPYKPILRVMYWLGKAPRVVEVIDKATVAQDVAAAGFVDLEQPDVGAGNTTSFLVAHKPT